MNYIWKKEREPHITIRSGEVHIKLEVGGGVSVVVPDQPWTKRPADKVDDLISVVEQLKSHRNALRRLRINEKLEED